jgi:hypothetical protein
MKHIEVEMLSETINCPVVSMPGRKFPGVVVQGDSLKNLLNLTEEIEGLSKSEDRDELEATIAALKTTLDGYVKAYTTAMKAHNRSLPWGE